LHGIAAVARGENLAAAFQADGPVGEAIGFVARPDDQAGANDQRMVRKPFLL